MPENNWAYLIAVTVSAILIGLFVRMWTMLNESNKKVLDLEYKDEKNESKEKHKDDSIDTIIARLKSKFGWKSGDS